MSPFYSRYLLLALLPLITGPNPLLASLDSPVDTSFTCLSGGSILLTNNSPYPRVTLDRAVDATFPNRGIGLHGNGLFTWSPSEWQSIQLSSTSGCYFDGGGIDFMRNIYFKNNSETSAEQDQADNDNRIDRSSTLHLNFDEKKLVSSVVSIQGPSFHFSYDETNTINKIIDGFGVILFDNSDPSHVEDRNVYPNADLQELPQESQIDKVKLVLKEKQSGVMHEISYFRNSENVCRLDYRKVISPSESSPASVSQSQGLLNRKKEEVKQENIDEIDPEYIDNLRKAAGQGNPEAQYQLACHLLYNCEKNFINNFQAFDLLRRLARRGYKEAQFMLGYCFCTGHGVRQNYKEGAKWFLEAAKQGLPIAQYYLGENYASGLGVEKDLEEAITWFQKAAEQGEPLAQFRLGFCYLEGIGIGQDLQEAATWSRRAAEQGEPRAQFILSRMYWNAQGMEKNMQEAIFWCRKAAEQGEPYAQCALGVGYFEGDGVEKDLQEATTWFLRAAKQGNANAQLNLALIYTNGLGVERDLEEAAKWLQKAAEQEKLDARNALN